VDRPLRTNFGVYFAGESAETVVSVCGPLHDLVVKDTTSRDDGRHVRVAKVVDVEQYFADHDALDEDGLRDLLP
jgi:hypothetical protein